MPDLTPQAPMPQATGIFHTREFQPGEAGNDGHLRLLSYNIQIGITSTRYRHYVTRSWRHVLPHLGSLDSLNQIAGLVGHFDIVALQEVDAGSFRSFFINQIEYLARRGNFPHWYYQTNRNLGKFAQHSNGLLSRIAPHQVIEHKLPGVIPGRGVMEVQYGGPDNPLVLLLVHLGLGKRARLRQLDFVSDLVNQHRHVVVMGDFNCRIGSPEMNALLARTSLSEPADDMHTFPSWRPNRNIDHILVTDTIQTRDIQVLPFTISDHLPIAVDIIVPEGVDLQREDHAGRLPRGGIET